MKADRSIGVDDRERIDADHFLIVFGVGLLLGPIQVAGIVGRRNYPNSLRGTLPSLEIEREHQVAGGDGRWCARSTAADRFCFRYLPAWEHTGSAVGPPRDAGRLELCGTIDCLHGYADRRQSASAASIDPQRLSTASKNGLY
jgi:hypothetical protein